VLHVLATQLVTLVMGTDIVMIAALVVVVLVLLVLLVESGEGG
jgi:hypothetical protein